MNDDDKTIVEGRFDHEVTGHATDAHGAMMEIVAKIVSQSSEDLLRMVEKFQAAGAPAGFDETTQRELTYNDVKLLCHMGYAATATVQFGIILAMAVSQLPPQHRERGLNNAYKRLEQNMAQSVAEAKLIMVQTIAMIDLQTKPPSNNQPI